MARLRFTVSNEAENALAAATAETVLQLIAPADQDVAIRGLSISFDGTSGSAEPGIVEMLIQTSAGTSAAATAVHEERTKAGRTIRATALKNFTAEPTGNTPILRRFHCHPQTGVEFRWWIDEEILLLQGERLGVRVTMPAVVNCLAVLYCEE